MRTQSKIAFGLDSSAKSSHTHPDLSLVHRPLFFRSCRSWTNNNHRCHTCHFSKFKGSIPSVHLNSLNSSQHLARVMNTWTTLRHHFVQLVDNFRTTFRQFWNNLGTTLWQLWDHFGTTFGDYWILSPVGSIRSFFVNVSCERISK